MLLKIAHLRLELLQAVVGGAQRLILHDDGLGQEIGRIGQRLDGVRDEGLGVLVARRGAGVLDALEQALEQLTFLG